MQGDDHLRLLHFYACVVSVVWKLYDSGGWIVVLGLIGRSGGGDSLSLCSNW